jgi:hypothetical protein
VQTLIKNHERLKTENADLEKKHEGLRQDFEKQKRSHKRKLTREELSTQIKTQDSLIKASLLSSIAGISTAFQVWSKYSQNETTASTPALKNLVVVIILQTWFSVMLFSVQTIDNSLNIKVRFFSFERVPTAWWANQTLTLLLFGILAEVIKILLMIKLQGDYESSEQEEGVVAGASAYLTEKGWERLTFAVTVIMAVVSGLVDSAELFAIFKRGTYKKILKE